MNRLHTSLADVAAGTRGKEEHVLVALAHVCNSATRGREEEVVVVQGGDRRGRDVLAVAGRGIAGIRLMLTALLQTLLQTWSKATCVVVHMYTCLWT